MKLLFKIVTVVLFLFVVIPCLVLVAMHFRAHAGRLEASVEIARPPQQVWAWLTEPGRVTQWVGGLKSIEGEAGPSEGVGHRETWVMADPSGKQGMRVPAEFTAWEPLRSMSGRIRMAGAFDGEFTYTLADLGGRSRVTQVSDWRYHGISWLLEPLVTPAAQRKMVEDFATLKARAEAEPVLSRAPGESAPAKRAAGK